MAKFVKCGEYWINVDLIVYVDEDIDLRTEVKYIEVFFSPGQDGVFPIRLKGEDMNKLLRMLRKS